MFEISQDEIQQIERLLLPHGCNFTEEQVRVLCLNNSFDVVACPGSGKTAVLIAKIAILLKKMSDSSKGICVITHTNVGVEEILRELQRANINNLSHPHFIGTIHDFLNTFFAMRAYNLYFNNSKRVNILDDDDYQRLFSRQFKRVLPWWTVRIPMARNRKVNFDNNGSVNLIDSDGSQRDNAIAQSINVMLVNGFLRHTDTLTLSEWYIKNHLEDLQKAFRSRFQFLFIDETQDTSIQQYDLVCSIFNCEIEPKETNVIIQRFGDPYQALYNLYNDEDDAWVPRDEDSIQIATSNRFGETIATVLRTTCIKPYTILQGNPGVNSYKPYMFIFNERNKQKLLETYAEVILDLEKTDDSFKNSSKRVYAVCKNHDDLINFSSDYTKKTISSGIDSSVKQCHDEIFKLIIKILRHFDVSSKDKKGYYTVDSLKEYLSEYHDLEYIQLRKNITAWVRRLHPSSEEQFNDVARDIKLIIEELIITIWKVTLGNDVPDDEFSSVGKKFIDILDKKKQNEKGNPNVINHEGVIINLDSIHAVKGETHRATLIIESTSFLEDDIQNKYGSDLCSIFGFLMGEHDAEIASNEQIKKYLKLAYVGLSRPTHFVGIAINEVQISKLGDLNQILNRASDTGWNIVVLPNIAE